jgi:hypothetical protein
MHTRTHSYGLFLLVSLFGAFVTATALIVVIQLSLPPTDLAYGQSIFTPYSDPFVRAIVIPVAAVSGLLASPLLYFCLRRRRLFIALPIIFSSVLAAVVMITPFSQVLGLSSAFGALVVSCILCCRIRATSSERSHEAA